MKVRPKYNYKNDIYLSDELDYDLEIEIEISSNYSIVNTYINKDEAILIINHLKEKFGI